MAFTFAGQYTEAILATGSGGATLLPSLPAHLYTVGTSTHVTIYTSRTKGTTTANPVTSDVNGNVTFFADPGQYDLVFTPTGGTLKRVTVTIPVDPAEASGTYVASTNGSAFTWNGSPVSFGGGVPTVVNVKDYGALGDGVTNDGPAIRAAVAAAIAAGGPAIVYFPASASFYKYGDTTVLSLVGSHRITLRGAGYGKSLPGVSSGPSELRYTSAGSATFIDAHAHFGFAIDGMAVTHSSATYTGTLIDASSGAGSGSPSYGFTARNSIFGGTGSTLETTPSAACAVSLDGIVEAYFDNCVFTAVVDGVIGLNVGISANFSNAVQFNSCRFTLCSDASVLNPGVQWTWTACIFEPKPSGAAAPVKSSSGARAAKGLSFFGCGFWDGNTGYWIDAYGTGVSVFGGWLDTLGAEFARLNTDVTLTTFDGFTMRGLGGGTNNTPIAFNGSGTFKNIDASAIAGLPVPDGIGGATQTVGFVGARGGESYVDLGIGGLSVTLTRDNVQKMTLQGGSNTTVLTFPAVPTGVAHSFTLELVANSGGATFVTWPASVKWGSAGAPTLSPPAGGSDFFTFYTRDGGTSWFGFTAGKGFV